MTDKDLGGVLCGRACDAFAEFWWGRRLARGSATIVTTSGRKVLAGDTVVVRVKTVWVSWQQVFLRFFLGGKVAAVVVQGHGVGWQHREERGHCK